MPKKASTTVELQEKSEKEGPDILDYIDEVEKEKSVLIEDEEKVDVSDKSKVNTTCKGAGDAPIIITDSDVTPSTSGESIATKSKKKTGKKGSTKSSKKTKQTSAKSKKDTQTVIEIKTDEEEEPSLSQDSRMSTPTKDVLKQKFLNLGRKSTSKTPKSEDLVKDEQEPKAARPKRSVKDRLLTDFFPVRRSDRRSKAELEKMETQRLEEKILSGCEEGLQVVDFDGKGRGVISTRLFKRGDFIIEYAGDLITLTEAQMKEDHYSQNPDVGCYMYYFKFKNKNYCVDATAESGKLGRLLNHSKNGNCKTKVVGIGNRPYLILIAARDIAKNEELLYDYGDRSKEALEAHPWLAY